MEATDVNARWQAEMAAVLRAPRRAPDTGSCASRRSSTLTDAPVRRDRPRRVERARGRAGGSTTGASRSTWSTASPNRPVRLPGRPALEPAARCSPRRSTGCAARGPLDGVGVDTWGVDYALLDGGGRVLGLPFHYRDARTDGMVDRAFARVPRAELYAATGIQTMPINTVFQLLADEGSPALARPSGSRSCPDLLALLAHRRARQRGHDRVDDRAARRAHRRRWARGLIERLGLPGAPVRRRSSSPARRSGRCSPTTSVDAPGRTRSPATTPPRPSSPRRVRDEHAAILSSGTWSLLGLELHAPVLAERARGQPHERARRRRHDPAAQERHGPVARAGVPRACGTRRSYDELHRLAAAAPATSRCSTPTPTRFLAPGDMPARIADACERAASGARGPRRDRALDPRLARLQVPRRARAARGASRAATCARIHVIGGGARNELLCRLTADVTGREVLAGPVEATALGNVLVQARARRRARLARRACAPSPPPRPSTPSRRPTATSAEETYRRFLDVTGLATPTTA